ncbi:unnamed protein product [Leuciscus chuanchicus]
MFQDQSPVHRWKQSCIIHDLLVIANNLLEEPCGFPRHPAGINGISARGSRQSVIIYSSYAAESGAFSLQKHPLSHEYNSKDKQEYTQPPCAINPPSVIGDRSKLPVAFSGPFLRVRHEDSGVLSSDDSSEMSVKTTSASQFAYFYWDNSWDSRALGNIYLEQVAKNNQTIRRDSSSKSPVISRGPQLRANAHHSELTANAKTHSREKKRPEKRKSTNS